MARILLTLAAWSINASKADRIVANEGRFGGGEDTSGWVCFASSIKRDFNFVVD